MNGTKRVYVSSDGGIISPEDQELRTIYGGEDGTTAYEGVDIPIPYDTPVNETRAWVQEHWDWVRSQLPGQWE